MYIVNNGKWIEGIVWWDEEPDYNAPVDIMFFIHDYRNRSLHPFKFKTLEIPLSWTRKEIFDQFDKNIRNYYNRAIKENLKVKVIRDPSPENVEEYVELFNKFADWKKISRVSKKYINELASNNKLIISYVYLNGEKLLVQGYYHDSKRIRQYHSFGVLNNQSKIANDVAGAYLTTSMIEWSKNNNFETYDLGGIGNSTGDNERFAGIIKFKRKFGGIEKEYWKGSTPVGENGEKIFKENFNHK